MPITARPSLITQPPRKTSFFADRDKDIAITPNGKYPLKYPEQGKYILNGSDPGDDWHGWIPNSTRTRL